MLGGDALVRNGWSQCSQVVGRLNQREVWSKATGTIARCTRAMGRVALGEDGWGTYT